MNYGIIPASSSAICSARSRSVCFSRAPPGRRRAQDRLRQYRRDQCAAHRQQGAGSRTLLLDALKGAAAVLIAGAFGPDVAICAGLGAFLGHSSRSGSASRAARASLSLSACCWPLAGGAAAVVWTAMALFRYSSLSALVAAVVTPIYMVLFHRPHETVLAVVLAVLVLIIHHENIRRLLRGEEPRIGAKSAAS